MVNMQTFKHFLEEKRRNPEQNPKISAYESLKKYKDDPDIYVSFTSLKKVGIKPLSGFNTPNGIYTYPLKEIWKSIEADKKASNVPYGGNRPYIHVLRSKNKPTFVKDMYSDYGSNDYDRDMAKIRKFYENDKNYDVDLVIDEATQAAKSKNPITSFWNVTRWLANDDENPMANKRPTQNWNNLLRKLGYSGFADKSGRGIIHPAERLQAVFLSKDSFTLEEMILNKNYDRILIDDKNVDIYVEKFVEVVNLKTLLLFANDARKPSEFRNYVLRVSEKDVINSVINFYKKNPKKLKLAEMNIISLLVGSLTDETIPILSEILKYPWDKGISEIDIKNNLRFLNKLPYPLSEYKKNLKILYDYNK